MTQHLTIAPGLIPCRPDLPRSVSPILIIGTGGIVKDVHLPACRQAGFPVCGLSSEFPQS